MAKFEFNSRKDIENQENVSSTSSNDDDSERKRQEMIEVDNFRNLLIS